MDSTLNFASIGMLVIMLAIAILFVVVVMKAIKVASGRGEALWSGPGGRSGSEACRARVPVHAPLPGGLAAGSGQPKRAGSVESAAIGRMP